MKTFLSIFAITALITHIWTTIIGFSEAGFWGGIITLILPVLSEIYWMFKMFGENNIFAIVALIHLLLSIPVSILRKAHNNK